MLLEAPATIPQFDRTSPTSGYVVPAWFATTLHVAIIIGASACLLGPAAGFVTSALVLLHIASWPMLYGIGCMAATAGFIVSGGAHWIESRLRRSGYLEGPSVMSRLGLNPI